MATAIVDGIETRYEVHGSGPPLLMFSPGGFDATVEKWSTLGIYARVKPLAHLSQHYSCITFDRRECGQSGGRVEAVTWPHYVRQAKGLLHHLGIERAHLMGGCMGCAPAVGFAAAHPKSALSMILWWPVGGARYRAKGRQRFNEHIAFAQENGLGDVVERVRREGKPFGTDPASGPWASVIKRDADFAERYARLDRPDYLATVAAMRDALLDRDSAPGAETFELNAMDIPAYVVPGDDESHATSAAKYLSQSIPRAQYWDTPPDGQTEAGAATRLLDFLSGIPKP